MDYKTFCTNMAMQGICDSPKRTNGKMLSSAYSAHGMYIVKRHNCIDEIINKGDSHQIVHSKKLLTFFLSCNLSTDTVTQFFINKSYKGIMLLFCRCI